MDVRPALLALESGTAEVMCEALNGQSLLLPFMTNLQFVVKESRQNPADCESLHYRTDSLTHFRMDI